MMLCMLIAFNEIQLGAYDTFIDVLPGRRGFASVSRVAQALLRNLSESVVRGAKQAASADGVELVADAAVRRRLQRGPQQNTAPSQPGPRAFLPENNK